MNRLGTLVTFCLISCTSMVLTLGCSSETGPEMEDPDAGKFDEVACSGATLDANGYCRTPDGRFTYMRCCEVELLADCIAETEECLGHTEDESYADACGDVVDGTMCVSTEACPAWVFEDPERTPHQIMRIDISDQCSYVCAEWMPDCMTDRGYDEELDLDSAFQVCFEESGCRSDVCTRNPDLCEQARANFEDSRSTIEPTEPDPDPTEPEEWTIDQCRDETEECLGHTEDETYLEACGDDPSPAVCVNEESCPQWIFEDPTRTPLEILDLDISEQCDYVCSQYLPDCMYEQGWDDVTMDQALVTCIDESGCTSDICDTDPSLCAEAREQFENARD